jgi:hypothetical protein
MNHYVCIRLFFLPDITMRINGRTFPGTTHELDNARRLRRTVGNISPYPEFRPTLFPHADIMVFS